MSQNDDLISRQAAIELVKNSYYNLGESMEDTFAMVREVEQLPSVEPEQKVGEWVQVPRFEGDTQPDLECPFCKHKVGWWDITKYCSECGADMRGETE